MNKLIPEFLYDECKKRLMRAIKKGKKHCMVCDRCHEMVLVKLIERMGQFEMRPIIKQ